ncbi:O-antigen ligase family protein [Lonsdalea quercina]|uniref:O-antigen ligase family protein n=1 Tax=Lonsdalea quercina TaxID=71657 RepID=UPI0039749629
MFNLVYTKIQNVRKGAGDFSQKVNMSISSRKPIALFLLAITLLLCSFWAIPSKLLPFHRNLLIYGAFVFSLLLFFKDRRFLQNLDTSKIKNVLVILGTMTVVTLSCALLFSPHLHDTMRAWHSQWMRPLMLFVYGLVFYSIMAFNFPNLSYKKLITAIILSFWAPIFLHILTIAYIYFKSGVIMWGETYIFPSRLELSFQINLISIIIFSDLLLRILENRRLLTLNTGVVVALIFSNVIATGLANTRWGTVGMIFGILSISLVFIIRKIHAINLWKLSLYSLLIICTVVSVGLFSYEKDPRWKSIKEDVEIGWNAPSNSFCFIFNSPERVVPLHADGTPVSHSNACRIAYVHQATEFIVEHPLGIGTSKTAFLQRLHEKYHNPLIDISHSHSGLLEYGLQYGVLGMLLWIIYNLMIFKISIRAFFKENKTVGVVLLLLSSGFFFRSMVDRILLDHYMEEYMFLSGLLLGIIAYKPVPSTKTANG